MKDYTLELKRRLDAMICLIPEGERVRQDLEEIKKKYEFLMLPEDFNKIANEIRIVLYLNLDSPEACDSGWKKLVSDIWLSEWDLK